MATRRVQTRKTADKQDKKAKVIAKYEALCSTDRAKRSFASSCNPDGSYTGTPIDGGNPVQDVDDL